MCLGILQYTDQILNVFQLYFTFTFYNLVFIFRDMKPENVLIGRAERMKENVLHVVDFGLFEFISLHIQITS